MEYKKEEGGMSMFTNFFAFWDVESTSKEPTEDDIISIGCVLTRYDGKKFLKIDEFHTYVHTVKAIDPIAESIHHISKQMLNGQPKFVEAMSLFKSWINQWIDDDPNARVILLAHNGSRFDDIMLFCNFVSNRMDFEGFLSDIKCYGFVDTLKMLRTMFKSKSICDLPKDCVTQKVSFTLGNCYKSWCNGLDLEGAHDALVDSQGLHSIFNCDRVTGNLDRMIMFKHVNSRVKCLKQIKQAAGMKFQQREEYTRREWQREQDIENSTDEFETIQNEFIDVCIPVVWENKPYDMRSNSRLCLNCMSFFKEGQHKMCVKIPQSCSV